MTHPGDFFVRFYLPILVGIISIIVAFRVREIRPDTFAEVAFSIPFTPVAIRFPIPQSAKRVWVARTLTIILALLLIGWGLNADFSRFYPSHMNVDVYFDEMGIEKTMHGFDKRALAEMNVDSAWKTCGEEYEAEVKSSLARAWAKVDPRYVSDTIGMGRANTQAAGETSFIVERVGRLAYRIVQSRGELLHSVDIPGREVRPFRTIFELRESAANHIRPELSELVRNGSFFIRPEFKQSIAAEAHRDIVVPFDHVAVGLTEVRLLPFPSFGNTLFFWKGHCAGAVPIGYAVYF